MDALDTLIYITYDVLYLSLRNAIYLSRNLDFVCAHNPFCVGFFDSPQNTH